MARDKFDQTRPRAFDFNRLAEAVFGFDNKGSFVYKEQLDSAAGTVKTHTITNIVMRTHGHSTNQDNPNGMTYSGANVGTDSVWSVA